MTLKKFCPATFFGIFACSTHLCSANLNFYENNQFRQKSQKLVKITRIPQKSENVTKMFWMYTKIFEFPRKNEFKEFLWKFSTRNFNWKKTFSVSIKHEWAKNLKHNSNPNNFQTLIRNNNDCHVLGFSIPPLSMPPYHSQRPTEFIRPSLLLSIFYTKSHELKGLFDL